MTRSTIAFLDSGIGGLPYLARARALMPSVRCVYLADRANFPYGGKRRPKIIAAVESAAGLLIQREDPSLIVVACNTASVVALEHLRSRFPIPFVGVVPAVKPAAAASPGKRFGILATRRTVEGRYLRDLVSRHARGCGVVSLPASDLVEFVERDLPLSTRGQRLARVTAEVERFKGIDTLVLGCTHFLHLQEEFREVLDARGIAVIDSLDGVTRQVVRLLGMDGPGDSSAPQAHFLGTASGPAAPGGEGAPGAFYVTGGWPVEERYRLFAELYGLEFAGQLP